MKWMWLAVVSVALLGCTKANPNLCCIDQADCAAHGLETGRTCAQGEVCRQNACVVESCTVTADCDAQAPYCATDEGTCLETCTGDGQCPGLGEAGDARFCLNGNCAACRASTDCPQERPVCDGGSCGYCKENSECAIGVCGTDGSCASASSIAFVAPSGSSATACEQLAPCSLVSGVASGRPYVLLAPGNYVLNGTLDLAGNVSLVGATPRPTLTNSKPGPVLSLTVLGDVSIDNLEITHATSDSNATGAGFVCQGDGNGIQAVHIRNSALTNNANYGLYAHSCSVALDATSMTGNSGGGIDVVDTSLSMDRCVVADNSGSGNEGFPFYFDDGTFKVTNSFFVRNTHGGVHLYSVNPGNQFDFNTIADNTGPGAINGVDCFVTFPLVGANDIVERNAGDLNTVPNPSCTFTNSIIGVDIAMLHFKSPDVAPYDYHLMHGSIAIDAASASTLDHDFDGDARPKGAARDIGADEAE